MATPQIPSPQINMLIEVAEYRPVPNADAYLITGDPGGPVYRRTLAEAEQVLREIKAGTFQRDDFTTREPVEMVRAPEAPLIRGRRGPRTPSGRR